MPFWLPTNSRPPATVGCDQADVASGNPNAHFSVSFGTDCSAVSPACSAGLIAGVGVCRRPAAPARRVGGDHQRRDSAAASEGRAGDVAAEDAAREVLGDRAALGAREAAALRTHAAGGQGGQDRFRRSAPEDIRRGRARVRRAGVAAAAFAREDGAAVRSLGGQPFAGHETGHCDRRSQTNDRRHASRHDKSVGIRGQCDRLRRGPELEPEPEARSPARSLEPGAYFSGVALYSASLTGPSQFTAPS